MRSLIATTALALILGGPALAQTQEQGQQPQEVQATQGQEMAQGGFYQAQQGDMLVTSLVGTEVYVPQSRAAGGETEQAEATEPEAEPLPEGEQAAAEGEQPMEQEQAAGQQMQAGAGQTVSREQLEQMENIGSVEDVIVGEQGELRAVVIDAGGFLGIGSRMIALDTQQVTFARDAEDGSQLYIVSQIGADELEGAPEFDPSAVEQQMAQGQQQPEDQAQQQQAQQEQEGEEADVVVVTEGEGEQPAAEQQVTEGEQPATEQQMTEDQPAAGDAAWRTRERMARPMIEREGYQMAETGQFTADNLMNASVYDINDESIGSVSDVVLSQDGQLEYIVLDVGGFLGLGSHTVALSLDEVTIMTTEAGDDLRAYVEATEEQLEAMPEYEEG